MKKKSYNDSPTNETKVVSLALYFKLYTWNRSSWEIPTRDKFNTLEFSKNYVLNSLLDKINDHFVSYQAVENWHVSFLDGIISQIKYFYKLNIFENKEDLIRILKDLKRLIAHLKRISETSHKQCFGKNEKHASINVYLNYTHTSSSLMYIKTPQYNMIYNLFLHPNYIRTSDKNVCNYAEKWISKIINQSELISGSGEITRISFLETLTKKINVLENELNN